MKGCYIAILILLSTLFSVFITSLSSSTLYAQELTLKEVKERQQQAKQAIEKAAVNQRGLKANSHTPLQVILSIGNALNEEDYLLASSFLDLRLQPKELTDQQKSDLIRHLSIVWAQQNVLDITLLSDDPVGHLDDGLAVNRDILGVIETEQEDIPIFLQRIQLENGEYEWRISSNSVAKIPGLWQEFGYHPWAESLAQHLPHFIILDMENWQFVSFIIILIVTWYVTALVRLVFIKIVSISDTYSRTMRRFIRVPLRLFLFFIILQWAIGHLGLSINARVWVDTGTLSYLAAVFLSLGIIEFCFALYESKASQEQNVIALIRPMVTTLKIITVIIIALNWFDDAGFNITAIITGLGIGSLAVALAAQKSLENVFGAFTLFFARPIKPGDMCKFGNTRGRVEEIGLRSTKIRKLNRAVVYVPNSVIASMDLENITEIDNRWYQKQFRIRLDTSYEQLTKLLASMRELINNHKNTVELERYVRLADISEDAFIIVVNAYVTTRDRVKYKEYEERLNLDLLQLIDQQGIALALPQQSISIQQSPSKPNNDTK